MKRLFFCIFIVFSAKSQSETWLQTSRFFPLLEENVDIFIYQGLNFQGKISTFSEERFQNFKHFGPKAKKVSDESSTIKVKFIEEGTHIIAIETAQSNKNYSKIAFQNYINELGGTTISLQNNAVNITEIKKEYGKMLIQVGESNSETTVLESNQRLEIIPIENPFGKKMSVSFKILFDKVPLSGVSLMHFAKTNSQTSMFGEHSDKNGIVNFPINRGLHFFKVTYITPSADKTIADFETHIASLTFGKK